MGTYNFFSVVKRNREDSMLILFQKKGNLGNKIFGHTENEFAMATDWVPLLFRPVSSSMVE